MISHDVTTLESEVAALIKEQILETGPDFSAATDLYDAGLDSMAIMQLLVVLEEKYGVAVSDAELTTENFRSVHQLAVLLHSRLVSG